MIIFINVCWIVHKQPSVISHGSQHWLVRAVDASAMFCTFVKSHRLCTGMYMKKKDFTCLMIVDGYCMGERLNVCAVLRVTASALYCKSTTVLYG